MIFGVNNDIETLVLQSPFHVELPLGTAYVTQWDSSAVTERDRCGCRGWRVTKGGRGSFPDS